MDWVPWFPLSFSFFFESVFTRVTVISHSKLRSFKALTFEILFRFISFDLIFQGTFSSLLVFHSSIYCIFVKMSDNHIIIDSDSKSNIFSSSKREMESESHSFSSFSGDFKLEIASLFDVLEPEWVFGDSISDRAPSRDPSKTLFSKKADGGEISVEKPLLPPVLPEVEIEVARRRLRLTIHVN